MHQEDDDCGRCGWEDQSEPVVWRFMMASVQEEVHGDAPGGRGLGVEQEPMDEVFHRSPGSHSNGKECCEHLRAVRGFFQGLSCIPCDEWQPQRRYDPPRRSGQVLHPLFLEEPQGDPMLRSIHPLVVLVTQLSHLRHHSTVQVHVHCIRTTCSSRLLLRRTVGSAFHVDAHHTRSPGNTRRPTHVNSRRVYGPLPSTRPVREGRDECDGQRGVVGRRGEEERRNPSFANEPESATDDTRVLSGGPV
mmetsp:Transcript_9905/g.60413  ORF Transcript_9905/g.60413 Transcript_9905/m.60413 type:complete len:247 (+) Transcript_9905:1159-1899(+)